MTPKTALHLNSLDLEGLVQREILRCTIRIEECESREAALGPQPDPKLRAANDRDRDRAFVSLRRAVSMLKDIPKTTPAPAEPVAKPGLYLVPKPEPVTPAPGEQEPDAAETPEDTPAPVRQIARNALCPCNSGAKYKRCCGRQAPPLPLRAPIRLPKAA